MLTQLHMTYPKPDHNITDLALIVNNFLVGLFPRRRKNEWIVLCPVIAMNYDFLMMM